ncbi:sugar ABC transporter substrate-binding protein [Amycolatopsis pithecellobii]|uniref:sugar ABC transporter substrate-binding protein n=1 Tax=Amycolatopsis pithecellobii TaxID=664692 RepID=UPI00140E4251|nr:substrate-binding domain-containing protein [Amycolatopsis pithecellobii]
MADGPAAHDPATDTGVAAAKAQIAAQMVAPTSVGITKPIKPAVAGKTVVYLKCAIVNCKIHADALAESFKPLGLNLRVVDSGLTPESFKNALATAKALHPDGVISDAIPAAIAQTTMDEMAAEGISVVSIVAPDLKLSDRVANVMGVPYMIRQGQTMANWTIADSGGHANVLYLSDTTLSFSASTTQGLKEAYAKNCPGCTVHELATNSGEIGTVLPNKISSYLQAHPDVKYVIVQYSALLTGVPAALATAGITGIKTIGASPTQINQQYMKAGQESAGIFNSNAAMAWYATDTVARLMSGEQPLPVVDDPPNLQLMTASQVTWEPKNSDYPWIPGWEQMFTKAWEANGS